MVTKLKNKIQFSLFLFISIFLFYMLMETCALAQPADTSIVSKVVDKFKTLTDTWMATAIRYAKILFYWVLALEIAYLGIRAALGAAEIAETIKNFTMALFTAAFFLAVISNYNEWAWHIIDGLKGIAITMGKDAGLTVGKVGSDNPFKVGLDLAGSLWEKAETLSLWKNAGLLLAMFVTSMIVIICFALITAQVIVIKCEAMLALLASCILLALGASKFFREYAVNTIRYVISVAFKLFVMQLLISVGFAFVEELKKAKEVDFTAAAVAICISLVILALMKTLPEVVAGIITGSHTGSGGALLQTAKAVGSAGLGAAAATVAGGKILSNANKKASAEGKSGMGRIASIGSTVMSGISEARASKASQQNTIGSKVKAQLDSARLKQSL